MMNDWVSNCKHSCSFLSHQDGSRARANHFALSTKEADFLRLHRENGTHLDEIVWVDEILSLWNSNKLLENFSSIIRDSLNIDDLKTEVIRLCDATLSNQLGANVSLNSFTIHLLRRRYKFEPENFPVIPHTKQSLTSCPGQVRK